MDRCRKCGSHAINDTHHGRKEGVDLDLCDVCYWRVRAQGEMVVCDHADKCSMPCSPHSTPHTVARDSGEVNVCTEACECKRFADNIPRVVRCIPISRKAGAM